MIKQIIRPRRHTPQLPQHPHHLSAMQSRVIQDLAFKRLNGDTQSMAHWKVLLHIVNHATLHRGQVMGMLRQLGRVPPGTDYLFYHLQI